MTAPSAKEHWSQRDFLKEIPAREPLRHSCVNPLMTRFRVARLDFSTDALAAIRPLWSETPTWSEWQRGFWQNVLGASLSTFHQNTFFDYVLS